MIHKFLTYEKTRCITIRGHAGNTSKGAWGLFKWGHEIGLDTLRAVWAFEVEMLSRQEAQRHLGCK